MSATPSNEPENPQDEKDTMSQQKIDSQDQQPESGTETGSQPDEQQGQEDQSQNNHEDQAKQAEDEQPEPKSKAHKDAAKYRARLREAKAQLEEAEAQRHQYLKATIDQVLPSYLSPETFWKVVDDDPEQFVDDNGAVSFQAVADKLAAYAGEFSGWFSTRAESNGNTRVTVEMKQPPRPLEGAFANDPSRLKRLNPGSNVSDAFKP